VKWNNFNNAAALTSGLYDFTSKQITPLKPEHNATFAVDVEHDPRAKCSQWLRMLDDCFMKDAATISVIQEIAGAALWARRPRSMMRILLLLGKPDSGKSNILYVLSRFIDDNPITTPFDELDKTHGTVEFKRNAPWVLHEAFEQSKWHPSARVKALASGDDISINVKSGPQFSHCYTGPIFWGSNPGPHFKEASQAMEKRMIIVPCNQTFEEEKPVGVALTARQKGYDKPWRMVIETERAGIFNWALVGLDRLIKRGYFELTTEMKIALSEMEKESNIVAGFLGAGGFEFDKMSMVQIQDFCGALTMWQSSEHGENRNLISNHSIWLHIKASFADRIIKYHNHGQEFYLGVKLTDTGLGFQQDMMAAHGVLAPGKLSRMEAKVGDVNKIAPVTLQRARELYVERLQKDRERKGAEMAKPVRN
jgi:phage/plasmid-associated DNA primase